MSTSDDAGIYRLTDELALVQTLDFITPIVDDPYTYGQIAAANSISDVYAMGGTPRTAMNIVCFPSKSLSMDVLGKILAGGADKAKEADIDVIGGHSVDDQEPKYGLVVTGTIHPDRVKTNATAQVGDKLILTKPIGSGIITTGIKKSKASDQAIEEVINVMTTLNRRAAETMANFDVHAVTDITGFGLLGHLLEMVIGAGVSASVQMQAVPVIAETWELADRKVLPGGAKRNFDRIKSSVTFAPDLHPDAAMIASDPQTSGGLLIAVNSQDADKLLSDLHQAGVDAAAIIGEIDNGTPKTITLA